MCRAWSIRALFRKGEMMSRTRKAESMKVEHKEGGNGKGRRVGSGGNGRRSRAAGQGDRLLIRSLKQGDQEALKNAIRTHHARLYRHVEGICRNAADTEEVLQDTYVAAWTKIGDFRGTASLFTWMYRIAVNMALMKRRHEEGWTRHAVSLEAPIRLRGEEDAFLTWVQPSESPEDTLLAGELREQIRRAAGGLARMYREVFELRDLYGLSIKETCDLLRLTASAAKSRLRRSRLSMQEDLKRYVETG